MAEGGVSVTAIASRDGNGWIVTCADFPGAISHVRTLTEAERAQCTAISRITSLPETMIHVSVRPELSAELDRQLDEAIALRVKAAAAERDAAQAWQAMARALHADGFSVRDIAVVLGISHQRVHQLVTKVGRSAAGPRRPRG